jgi:uncharacterized alpha-E superfamily protein
MLSRVADNLYWMSRYLERAEHTARLIDVNLALDLERSPEARGQHWGRVLNSLQASRPADGVDAYKVTRHLTFETSNPSSVVACISAARENARQVREQISSEMWEQINRFYLTVRGTTIHAIWRRQPHEFFRSVKEAIHFFQGLTDSTLGHAEGWQFIQVGRYLERAVAIASLLGVYYQRPGLPGEAPGGAAVQAPSSDADERAAGQTAEYLEWVGLLKSCTAFEAYCRAYTADLRPDRIAGFLLLDPVFPHSVRFSTDMVQAALAAIADETGRRTSDRINRLAGRLHATLRYGSIEEILASGLQQHLAAVEQQCLRIHDALYETYISYPIEQAMIA